MSSIESLTIKQMAAHTGLSSHTLRYYERIGLLDDVERDESSGHRRYTTDDVDRVIFLKHLRATDMPIRQIQQYIDMARQGDETIPERQALLEAHQRNIEIRLQEVMQHLEIIRRKVERYKQHQEQHDSACL